MGSTITADLIQFPGSGSGFASFSLPPGIYIIVITLMINGTIGTNLYVVSSQINNAGTNFGFSRVTPNDASITGSFIKNVVTTTFMSFIANYNSVPTIVLNTSSITATRIG